MAKTVGLASEELINKFNEVRQVMKEPEAMRTLSLFPKLYQSEELNEAVNLIETGIMAILVIINENNKAIAKSLKE